MANRRTLLALILAVGLVISQISAASAAPLSVTSTTNCTIKTATFDSGTLLWTVTCTDGSTITMTETQAQGTTPPLVDNTNALLLTPGQSFTFDSGSVTSFNNPCTLPTGNNQPVSAALADFFCGSTGATYQDIQDEHMLGIGFGEIAQALFMSRLLNTDWQKILDDKMNHDFSNITLNDGSHPKNWGQLMKYMLGQVVKNETNLGAIMSGRATPPTPTGTSTTAAPSGLTNQNGPSTHGKGGDHGGGNGHRPDNPGANGNGHP